MKNGVWGRHPPTLDGGTAFGGAFAAEPGRWHQRHYNTETHRNPRHGAQGQRNGADDRRGAPNLPAWRTTQAGCGLHIIAVKRLRGLRPGNARVARAQFLMDYGGVALLD